MKRIWAWLLFTFAAVNIVATAIMYTEGKYDPVMDCLKLVLIGLALWGWSRWK
jgi:hypothetical protein